MGQGTTMDLTSIISEVQDIRREVRRQGQYRNTNILDMAIGHLKKYNRLTGPCEVQMHYVLVNGEPTEQTIKDYTDKGWVHLGTENADKFHPYAMSSDRVIFLAKPIDKVKYDAEMKEFYEKHGVPETQA